MKYVEEKMTAKTKDKHTSITTILIIFCSLEHIKSRKCLLEKKLMRLRNPELLLQAVAEQLTCCPLGDLRHGSRNIALIGPSMVRALGPYWLPNSYNSKDISKLSHSTYRYQ
jgi:hypothetical protein